MSGSCKPFSTARKEKDGRHTSATDSCHLLLLLPFILSNLFRDEVEKHNHNHRAHLVNQLTGVANISLRWYKLYALYNLVLTGEIIAIIVFIVIIFIIVIIVFRKVG